MKKLVITWVLFLFLAAFNSGCALIGAAISAGIGYGIYTATNQ